MGDPVRRLVALFLRAAKTIPQERRLLGRRQLRLELLEARDVPTGQLNFAAFNDLNQNAVWESNEFGVPGVVLTQAGQDPGNSGVGGSVGTGAGGTVTETLIIGGYSYSLSIPNTYRILIPFAYSNNLTVSEGQTTTVQIPVVLYPHVQVSVATPTVSESGGSTGQFTFSRDGDVGQPLTVLYYLTGSARESDDYAAMPGSITIPAGATTAQVNLSPINDAWSEGTEIAQIELSPSPNYQSGSTTSAQMAISDDPGDSGPVVSIAAGTSSIQESSSAAGYFLVTRTGNLSQALTVEYETPGAAQSDVGDAVSGQDFTDAQGGTVTIAGGQSQASIEIAPVDDNWVEGAEQIRAWLDPTLVYDLGSIVSAQFTLNDDTTDNYTLGAGLPNIQITAISPSVSESGGTQSSFQVTRNGQLGSTVTVHYEMDGTAVPGVDYAIPSGSITFAPNQTTATISLSAVNDVFAQGNRSVEARLLGDSRYLIGDSNYATLTLSDDVGDTQPAVFVTAVEPVALRPINASDPGAPASFSISRSGSTANGLTVQYDVSGDATPGVDFVALSGQAVILAGQTSVDVGVTPIFGTTSDDDESLTIRIKNPTAGTYLPAAQQESGITLSQPKAATPGAIVFTVSFRHRDGADKLIGLASDNLTILFDPPNQATKYKAPHYRDTNHDGQISTATGTSERAYPIIYVNGQRIETDATFYVANMAPFRGKIVWVKAQREFGAGLVDYLPPIQASIEAYGFKIHDDRAPATFALQPGYEPAFTLAWEFSINGENGNYVSAGASTDPLHVTYSAPTATSKLYRTSVFQATVAIAGATSEADVRQKVWDGVPAGNGSNLFSFSARTVQTWDGKPLHYYLDWKTKKQTDAELIAPSTLNPATNVKEGDAECMAWARHFQNVMRIDGFDYQMKVLKKPAAFKGFAVKIWQYPAAGPFENVMSNSGGAPLEITGNIGEQKYKFVTVKVADQPGAKGQWVTNPASLFVNHVVVQVGSDLWDPSYGAIYPATDGGPTNNLAIAFQKDALDGYYEIKPVAGKTIMKFTKPSSTNPEVIISNYP